MEEIEGSTRKETVDQLCVDASAANRMNEATGEVSSQMTIPGSGRKPLEEKEARFKRLKLFDKVMQKSLEKFIDHAR